ncbi:MAG: hypothetical protein J4G14_11515 [Dehalococcoidia bacterium]|nr:hypothetical protein [Dehalococcoidia bacterium]
MHRATPRFWRYFERLPEPVQRLARRNFEILKDDPRYPSLQFKRVGRFRSVRVGLAHRALAVEDGEDFVWVWIGNHDDYDRMIES